MALRLRHANPPRPCASKSVDAVHSFEPSKLLQTSKLISLRDFRRGDSGQKKINYTGEETPIKIRVAFVGLVGIIDRAGLIALIGLIGLIRLNRYH